MVLSFLAQEWGWILFGIIFLVGLYLMPKWKRTQRVAKILFKINSHRGLKTMDRLGRGFSRFWVFIGNLALILLFGGLGTAFAAYHAKKEHRRIMLAVFGAVSVYVYISSSIIGFIPFTLFIVPSIEALAAALLIGAGLYKLSPRLSKNRETILVFLLAAAFFASHYVLISMMLGGSLTIFFLGLAMGVMGLPAFVLVSLAGQAWGIASGVTAEPGINIGYPTMEGGTPVLKYSGTDISIPIFPDIFVALVLLLVIHEGFHGLVARAQNIKVVNTGVLTASVIPLGAFVEPDEKQFKKEPPDKQLRIYAVGSFANIFVLAVIALFIGYGMLATGFVQPEGVYVGTIIVGSAADGINLTTGDIIYSIGGEEIKTGTDFHLIMAETEANSTVEVVTDRGSFQVELGENPHNRSVGYFGMAPKADPIMTSFMPIVAHSYFPDSMLFRIVKWIFFLNLMLGLINLLPIKPLDGGFVYEGCFKWLEDNSRLAKRIHAGRLFTQGFFIFVLAIFVVNFLPYFY